MSFGDVQILDQRMMAAEGFGPHQLSSLDSQLAEVEDVLSYCSDVLSNGKVQKAIILHHAVISYRSIMFSMQYRTGHPFLANMLAQQVWSVVIGPLLLAPLLQPPPQPEVLSPRTAGIPLTPKGTLPQPACALFVLERMFLLLEYRPLVNNIALALLGRPLRAEHAVGWEDGMRVAGSGEGRSFGADYDVTAAVLASSACPGAGRLSPLVEDLSEGGQSHPLDPDGARHGSCREAIVAALRGAAVAGSGRSEQLTASGAIRMLVAAAR